METEIWKDIDGFEGHYKVSNIGKVKSIKFGKEIILNPINIPKGYLIVNLIIKGYRYTRYIHRLVSQAFIQNIENKPQVNHINGNKSDNQVENLEWVTAKENVKHAWENGLCKLTKNNTFLKNPPSKGKFGKDNKDSKKVNQYTLEGEFIKTWDSIADIGRKLGIKNISTCCNGRQNTSGGFIWKFNKGDMKTCLRTYCDSGELIEPVRK